jgi:hypothetical protein
MKLTKIPGVAAVAALTLVAFTSTASATTLATNGVTQTGAVTLEASLTTGTSVLITDTGGSFANTCTRSTMEGTTTVFTGTTVSGPISTLSYSNCTLEPIVVHKTGSISIEAIGSGPNGTVRSTGVEVTVPFPPIGTVNCKTSNTDLGTLTGSGAGTAEIDVNAVVNCGFPLPSARWQATYVLTVPGTTTEEKHHISVVG